MSFKPKSQKNVLDVFGDLPCFVPIVSAIWYIVVSASTWYLLYMYVAGGIGFGTGPPPPSTYPPGPPGSSYPRAPSGSYPPAPSGSYPPRPPGSYPPAPSGSYPPAPSGSYPPAPSGSYPPAPSGSYPPAPSGTYQPSTQQTPGGYYVNIVQSLLCTVWVQVLLYLLSSLLICI